MDSLIHPKFATGTDFFRSKKGKIVFNHFKGLNCGHYHVSETKDKKSVDCYACLKLMQEKNLI